MAVKVGLGVDVLTAARDRIRWTFETFQRVYVSFSGGKDSTVMLHLAAEEARRQGRRFGLLFVDLEAQYQHTIWFVDELFQAYADVTEPFWVALPLNLRNAVSQFEPQWCCWEPGRESDWVRPRPKRAIGDEAHFPFFRRRMEFEEFVDDFGHWYGQGQTTACMVGIRSDESLNRYRTLAADKSSFQGIRWTTYKGQSLYNVYPIYDWRTADIWTFHGKTGAPHNPLYDLMHRAGLSIHQQRICQPYGDDQRRGLWLYHLIEPETWGRVVARVSGANAGALYVRESGNVLGNLRISKPPGHTWESFAKMLLASMPSSTAEHFKDKIAWFLRYHQLHGFPDGTIPDEADPKEEAARTAPSWRRICKVLLRNDFWCKGLTFSQHKTAYFDRYRKTMRARRQQWGLI